MCEANNGQRVLHGCGTESQVEVEQQIFQSRAGRFHKEEEEISGQMGDIIPPGCGPIDSRLPVNHAQIVWKWRCTTSFPEGWTKQGVSPTRI